MKHHFILLELNQFFFKSGVLFLQMNDAIEETVAACLVSSRLKKVLVYERNNFHELKVWGWGSLLILYFRHGLQTLLNRLRIVQKLLELVQGKGYLRGFILV